VVALGGGGGCGVFFSVGGRNCVVGMASRGSNPGRDGIFRGCPDLAEDLSAAAGCLLCGYSIGDVTLTAYPFNLAPRSNSRATAVLSL